jgi:malate dehydrogenase
VVEAVLSDSREVMPSCVLLEGHYGISGTYMSVPAVIGAGGVVAVPELDLTAEELDRLRASAAGIAEAFAVVAAG